MIDLRKKVIVIDEEGEEVDMGDLSAPENEDDLSFLDTPDEAEEEDEEDRLENIMGYLPDEDDTVLPSEYTLPF